MISNKKYDVKDLALAEAGRQRFASASRRRLRKRQPPKHPEARCRQTNPHRRTERPTRNKAEPR